MSQCLWENGEFSISTDKEVLNLMMIHQYLSEESYWAKNIPMDIVEKSIQNTALCFGIFQGRPQKKTQIGFARVISDLSTFAYLADVFVLGEYRGRGLGKWLINIVTNHAELQSIRKFMLATADAHSLYTKYGFELIKNPEVYMQIIKKNPYIN